MAVTSGQALSLAFAAMAWPQRGAAQAVQTMELSESWPGWAQLMLGLLFVLVALIVMLVWLLWSRRFIRSTPTATIRSLAGLNPAQPTKPHGLVAGPTGKALDAAHDPAGAESFCYTISHDLRAPIRVVEGFAKILKEDYGHQLDRIGNDHLERILGAATRMNTMIDALLALSQLSDQPLGIQRVDLSQLGHYVAEDLRRLAPGREVSFHIEPGLIAYGDPTLLRVVLENLLGNPWKYTSKRQHAQIALVRDPADAQSFIVYDNGVGFDMRFADRLFGVFQRLHSNTYFSGTGIGLASVRRIIKKHGGNVWGEAEVDRGARFHFSIGIPPLASPTESLQSR